MESGYFFCGDLLGFSSIVKSLTPDVLDKRILDWTSLVKEAATTHNISKYQLLSDTVFAAVSNSQNDLSNLINFARHLLNNGIPRSLPIRGAISSGQFNWGNLVYGRAVIEAHDLEKKQNWVGVTLQDNSIITEQDYIKLGIVCYAVPMTPNNPIQLYPAVSWNVPTFEELGSLLQRDGLGGVPGIGKVLDWNWGDKVANTTIFGLYIKALSETKRETSKFHGYHPVHFIDITLRRSTS